MEIIFEDNHLLVVNKPFGMPSQGDISGDESVVSWAKNYLKIKYNKPGEVYLGLVHRLDRPVGGIMVLARTSKAAKRLSADFQARKIDKVYYALTERIPAEESGELIHYLKKIQGKNIMRAFRKEVHASKKAMLQYKVLQAFAGKALVEVKLLTGRRHQIRVQLAAIGCVIRGDVKYGKTNFNADKSICLMAKQLSFTHPVKKEKMTFEVDVPDNNIWSLD